MDLDGILDPSSLVAMAEDAVDRALDALVLAVAARDAASGSAAGAAATLAKVQALAAGLGVTTQWVGTGKRQLQVMGPDGAWGPASGDLQGQKGDTGVSPVLRAGSKSTGPLAFAIDNTDPLNPIVNITIPAGANGWTPVEATVADGERRVKRVVDWSGGTGIKPAVGLYVGPAGLVADAASATDVRGPRGVSASRFIAASLTSVPIAVGPVSVVLTPDTAEGYATAQYLALVSRADPQNGMSGALGSYDWSTGTLTIVVDRAAGTGSRSDWIVTPTPPVFVPTGIDGGYAGDPVPPAGASPVYGASTATAYYGVDGGIA